MHSKYQLNIGLCEHNVYNGIYTDSSPINKIQKYLPLMRGNIKSYPDVYNMLIFN